MQNNPAYPIGKETIIINKIVSMKSLAVSGCDPLMIVAPIYDNGTTIKGDNIFALLFLFMGITPVLLIHRLYGWGDLSDLRQDLRDTHY